MAPRHPRTGLISVPGSACSTLPEGTSVDEYWGLELYRSWCCPSVCKDYPDMQLRGDQLGDRSSQSPHWVAPSDDWHPLLCSQDLGDMEALPGPEAPGDPLPWLGNLPHHHDDRYMEMDTSLQALGSMRGLDRLSNSMLNGYLETKLLEVYRQHLQDSLARSGGEAVSPGMVVPAVMPGSPAATPSGVQWVSQEQRPEGSIHYLSTCGLRSNSHFSSPELRISDIHPNHVKKGINEQ